MRRHLLWATLSFLVACGGGDGGGETPTADAAPSPADAALDAGADAAPGADAGLDAAPDGGPGPDAAPEVDAARVATPCVAVDPERLEFASTLVGRAEERVVQLQSCGRVPLTVLGARLTEESSGAFELVGPLPDRIEDASFGVVVRFTPTAAEVYRGTLVIETDDPDRPSVGVPLLGRGRDTLCPVPVARLGEGPPDMLVLDGAASFMPGGELRRYVWEVRARPAGSAAPVFERIFDPGDPTQGALDDEATPAAVLWMDVPGRYVLQLVVTDANGLAAPSELCPEGALGEVVYDDARRSGLDVALTWTRPDGSPADLDLKLARPDAAAWSDGRAVCGSHASNPDWGLVGDPGDDPALDVDSSAFGPERITLAAPQTAEALGGPYRVGVEYFAERGGEGPVDAHLEVRCHGALVWSGDHALDAPGAFWEPALIAWQGAAGCEVSAGGGGAPLPR